MRIVRTLRIWAPAARVWGLIDDERQIPRWMPSVLDTRYPQGKPAGNPIGARFLQQMQEGGKVSEYEGEVIAYEPGRMLGVRLLPQAFKIDVRYIVTGDEDQTQLDYICDMWARTWKGSAILLLGTKMLGGIAEQQMLRLKLLAEQGDGGA